VSRMADSVLRVTCYGFVVAPSVPDGLGYGCPRRCLKILFKYDGRGYYTGVVLRKVCPRCPEWGNRSSKVLNCGSAKV